jgi:methionine-rich copper-binding protein CopC
MNVANTLALSNNSSQCQDPARFGDPLRSRFQLRMLMSLTLLMGTAACDQQAQHPTNLTPSDPDSPAAPIATTAVTPHGLGTTELTIVGSMGQGTVGASGSAAVPISTGTDQLVAAHDAANRTRGLLHALPGDAEKPLSLDPRTTLISLLATHPGIPTPDSAAFRHRISEISVQPCFEVLSNTLSQQLAAGVVLNSIVSDPAFIAAASACVAPLVAHRDNAAFDRSSRGLASLALTAATAGVLDVGGVYIRPTKDPNTSKMVVTLANHARRRIAIYARETNCSPTDQGVVREVVRSMDGREEFTHWGNFISDVAEIPQIPDRNISATARCVDYWVIGRGGIAGEIPPAGVPGAVATNDKRSVLAYAFWPAIQSTFPAVRGKAGAFLDGLDAGLSLNLFDGLSTPGPQRQAAIAGLAAAAIGVVAALGSIFGGIGGLVGAAVGIILTIPLITGISLYVTEVDSMPRVTHARVNLEQGSTPTAVCTSASSASLVAEGYPDNSQVSEGQSFTKTWTLRNGGSNCVWDARIKLQYVSNSAGLLSTSQAPVAVSGTIQPNGTFVFSVPMRAPSSSGTYREDWKLVDANGSTIRVGNANTIWAQIVVPQSGSLLCTASSGAGFVGESHPDNTQIGAGQAFTKTWTLRNLGSNCVWDSRIKLQYVSNTAGLLSTSQAAVAVSGAVQPNGTFVFSVPMRAPSSPGTYREDWKLVDANGSTIRVGNSNTIWNQIVVPQSEPSLCMASSGAGFVGESHPDNTQVGAGQAFTKTWTLRNLGSNCIWDSRIKLQYVSNTAGLLSTSQAAVAVSGTVQPNGTFVFSVPMRAPNSPGTYREDWKLVDANGSTIRVGNSNTIWNQIVVLQSEPSLCTASSGAGFVGESHPDNTQVGAGQAFTKTWTLRNLGSNCIWDSRIKLQYVSNTAGLLSTSQAPVAVSGTIQPNGTFVFSVPMRAPSSPGTYREDWKLVDANGSTIRVGNSNTIWNQIVVTAAAPTVTGYSWNPSPPRANQGFSGTVSGSSFVAGGTEVWFCAANTNTCYQHPAAGVTVGGASTLSVVNVQLGAGNWQVYIRTSAGASGRSPAFTVAAAAPTVTGYNWNPSPPKASQSFGGTVSGSGFVAGGTEVWFCVANTNTCYQHPAAGVTVGNASSLSVVNVQLAAGSWQVYVRTSAGASGRSTAFTVQS